MACPTCGATKVRRVGGEPVALAEPPDREPPPDPSFARSSPSMPFTVVRPHAQGGLGQIALARDDRIMREVALKQILTVHADNPTLRKRFLYEARITGQLEHPSIVPVYCLGDDENGRPYYVMRFVRGRTLDDIITEYTASPNGIVFRELLRRFIAVCQAVAYAHARGVIHRDLKPSNIMLGDYGETLVLDWGLAKDIKNRSDPAVRTPEHLGTKKESNGKTPSMVGLPQPAHELTMQGQIIGTPAYMAPEQAAGRTELHGPVTDIYALGGILYKILTGKSPSAAKGATGMNGAVKTLTFVESPAPSQVHPGVDPGLEAICRRGMATDPAHRYPRALEMAQEIQRWLDEHPLTSGPVTMGSRFMAWLRRIYPVVAILLLLTLIGLLAALLVHGRR
jgi:serine/threonine protein kinase